MNKKIHTHYDNLGVSRNAQPEVIKAAYKALARKYHPDKNPDNADAERIMKIINAAYWVLIDPVQRAKHDRWIDEQESKFHANQSTQNQHNSSNHQGSHQDQNNQQTHYNNSHTQSHQTQSTTYQRYDYTESSNTQNQSGSEQNSHATYHNHQETFIEKKPSFWSSGRMRRTTYALLSIPTLFFMGHHSCCYERCCIINE